MEKREIRLVVDEVDIYNMKQAIGEEIKSLVTEKNKLELQHLQNEDTGWIYSVDKMMDIINEHMSSCDNMLRQLIAQEEQMFKE